MGKILQKLSAFFMLSTIIVFSGTSSILAQNSPISEIRLGIAAHSVDRPGPNDEPLNFTRLEDIAFEVLFFSPDIDAFSWIGSPKINFGTTINTNGRESKIHLALTWQLPIFETGFFVEGTLGAAIHNGAIDGVVEPARRLGSRFLFYEAAGIGYRFNDNMNVIIFAEHASNANLVQPNSGISNIGIKFGYIF
ncbi:MAG: acyloxyacyl hydrolase [Devosiaceae bacterium]|nr:acyloxyacyl hydrolase [Devosiaceae bacterium]